MALREEFEKTGQTLFRWRSYLPILMFILVFIVIRDATYPSNSHSLDQIWEIFCLCVSIFGLLIRVITIGCVPKGTSGRNIRQQVADVVNTTGMYSAVRHPLYLGNFFMVFGLTLMLRHWWFSLIYSLIFWIYYERIMFAEEEFLRAKFGERYLEWANRTPAFLPNFRLWKKPDLGFSWRWALKREYSSFFGLIVSFTVIETASDYFVDKKLEFDPMWCAIFGVSLVIYVVVRILSKSTKLLDVKGR